MYMKYITISNYVIDTQKKKQQIKAYIIIIKKEKQLCKNKFKIYYVSNKTVNLNYGK